jgi:hypothetical protein
LIHTFLAFNEATLGLLLVALLIAYSPTMYSVFSRRELAVSQLSSRAGMPPSATEMIVREPQAELCLRSGFLALRRIAEVFRIEHPADPAHPTEPISSSRAAFDQVCAQLAAHGVPLKADRAPAFGPSLFGRKATGCDRG